MANLSPWRVRDVIFIGMHSIIHQTEAVGLQRAIRNSSKRIFLAVAFGITGVLETMAIEEAAFKVETQDAAFEVRAYAQHILAETIVDGNLEEAGNQAFGRLFRYISGANRTHNKVAMTAPVAQQRAGEKIAMTAPVGQQRAQDKWAVSFMMPAGYTLETLPVPEDPQVKLRLVPARRMAAVRYSGFWSEKNYLKHKQELEAWIHKQGLSVKGEPVWARYNPPFTLWFLRRNEILIEVAATQAAEPSR